MKTLVYGIRESGIAAARALIERNEEVIVAAVCAAIGFTLYQQSVT